MHVTGHIQLCQRGWILFSYQALHIISRIFWFFILSIELLSEYLNLSLKKNHVANYKEFVFWTGKISETSVKEIDMLIIDFLSEKIKSGLLVPTVNSFKYDMKKILKILKRQASLTKPFSLWNRCCLASVVLFWFIGCLVIQHIGKTCQVNDFLGLKALAWALRGLELWFFKILT